MGNNQSLQVGAEAASALFGELLAALLTPLPLIVYGVLSIIGVLMLLPLRTEVAQAPAEDTTAAVAS
jgi:hypothetical protein